MQHKHNTYIQLDCVCGCRLALDSKALEEVVVEVEGPVIQTDSLHNTADTL